MTVRGLIRGELDVFPDVESPVVDATGLSAFYPKVFFKATHFSKTSIAG